MNNRKLRNQMLRENAAIRGRLSVRLEAIPAEDIATIPLAPGIPESARPLMVWRSRNYLVQLFSVENAEYPLMRRLAINRTAVRADGQWEDKLTWDEMNAIKQEVGYGLWYGVEVYPKTPNIVNDHNIRHLWLNPEPLSIGF